MIKCLLYFDQYLQVDDSFLLDELVGNRELSCYVSDVFDRKISFDDEVKSRMRNLSGYISPPDRLQPPKLPVDEADFFQPNFLRGCSDVTPVLEKEETAHSMRAELRR